MIIVTSERLTTMFTSERFDVQVEESFHGPTEAKFASLLLSMSSRRLLVDSLSGLQPEFLTRIDPNVKSRDAQC
ncbi:hypothetical protein Bpfe_000462 [Biomphalaria pfeifferi]|uniref:Uncharacterized protein n=1 Tax=Biomphalaria pfeifferi TaxID=112525 RepID=A0AAD8CEG2_BIOPF|nr:hypothetical protein Bpfe_000462 [Biomphalaria pfeifferi]